MASGLIKPRGNDVSEISKEEIIRIRNLGCGNEWPKVWNRQLNILCDMALQSVQTPPQPSRDAVLVEAAKACEAHVGVSMLCDTPSVERFYEACNKCAKAIRALKSAAKAKP